MVVGVSTLVECLRKQTELVPEKTAFSFLNDVGDISGILTYAELDRRARIPAETLRTIIVPRSSVLLLFEPGLDFIAALFGCLHAGMYAVPSYPPKPTGGERTLSHLKAIAADAAPAAITPAGARSDRTHSRPRRLMTAKTGQATAFKFWCPKMCAQRTV